MYVYKYDDVRKTVLGLNVIFVRVFLNVCARPVKTSSTDMKGANGRFRQTEIGSTPALKISRFPVGDREQCM